MKTSGGSSFTLTRQHVVLGAVFAIVTALLAVGYLLFLRTEYTVLFANLRPADAAAIKTELDKKGVDYRLRDGGTTVMVATGDADAARLELAGSQAAARGLVGFELFNKSDMGLTNFAQKINYQRALQGELVRTIMEMDGVESARVHLGIPERTLFRGDRHAPSAAVTLTMKPGAVVDPARVAGIQQLIASAVPELAASSVVVLDEGGKVVSPEARVDVEQPAGIEERGGLEQYYRARGRAAVEQLLPGLQFSLVVRVLPNDGLDDAGPIGGAVGKSESAAADDKRAGEDAERNYALRLVFLSTAALNGEDQQIVRNAIVDALQLRAASGDSLSFETGPLDPRTSADPAPGPLSRPALPNGSIVDNAPAADAGANGWLWGAMAAGSLVAGIALLHRLRSRRRVLDDAEHDAFAEQLRRQMALRNGTRDAAA